MARYYKFRFYVLVFKIDSRSDLGIVNSTTILSDNQLPRHAQLTSAVILLLRVEDRGRKAGEHKEARGEQEVGRGEPLK